MKTRYKIIIIVGIIAVSIPGIIIFGAVPLMIATNAYSGYIMSSTSDSVFEKDFAKIPEVKFFIEKYPNYTTSHGADFLGWKIIMYNSNSEQSGAELHVKKSVIHHGVKVSAACNNGGYSVTFGIIGEDVMDYLKNDECLKKSSDNYNVPIIVDIGKTGVYKLDDDGKIFDLDYSIKGASIEDVVFNADFNSLWLIIEVVHQGRLEITMPRELLDAKRDYCPPRQENPPDD